MNGRARDFVDVPLQQSPPRRFVDASDAIWLPAMAGAIFDDAASRRILHQAAPPEQPPTPLSSHWPPTATAARRSRSNGIAAAAQFHGHAAGP